MWNVFYPSGHSSVLIGLSFVRPNPSDFILSSLLLIQVLHFSFYLVALIYLCIREKRFSSRKLLTVGRGFLILFSLAIWGVAVYVFSIRITDKNEEPYTSREINQECVLLDYFDSHDIWHFLSALGLFSFVISLFILDPSFDPDPSSEYEMHELIQHE